MRMDAVLENCFSTFPMYAFLNSQDPKRTSPPALLLSTYEINKCTDRSKSVVSLGLTSGFMRRSGDAVSKLDWAGDGTERLEAFAGAKDRHVAIVEHAPEN